MKKYYAIIIGPEGQFTHIHSDESIDPINCRRSEGSWKSEAGARSAFLREFGAEAECIEYRFFDKFENKRIRLSARELESANRYHRIIQARVHHPRYNAWIPPVGPDYIAGKNRLYRNDVFAKTPECEFCHERMNFTIFRESYREEPDTPAYPAFLFECCGHFMPIAVE